MNGTMDFSDLTLEEKLALVETARNLWDEDIAGLLAEDMGLKPPPDQTVN